MQEIKRRVQGALSYMLIVLLATAYPVSTYAETAPVSDSATASPTVADTTPKTPPAPTYTYDAASGRWNTDSWQYDASTGTYKATPPPAVVAPIVVEKAAEPGASSTSTANSEKSPTETVKSDGQPTGSTSTTSSPTTAISLNSGAVVNTNNLIGNSIDSTAQTGNAAIAKNTLAGDATSGNASVSETIMNTINSSVASGAGGIANFVSNISGDVQGDILLYPMMLGAMLVQAALTPSTAISANTTLDANTNNQITNDINLNAASGSATVAGNTSAGNATSGSANAVANVMNMINSAVAANQSFVGTINIYGNLDGDILIAPDFLSQLIGSNGGTSSTALTQTANITTQTTDQISNNLNLNAASGSATVAGNTSAGNATSGSADTNVVILNLTGHEVVASNSMLVFVNVLGKWVGVIVDAPAGSTAAALGNGINQDIAIDTNAVISAQTNNQITNNINLVSTTGDATVTRNTSAGNATTGNATASANILNMSDTSFGLSGWFGVLFINVFGSWLGSFGVDTARGNPTPAVESVGGGSQGITTASAPQAIQFVPKVASSVSTWRPSLLTASSVGGISMPPSVLGSQTAVDEPEDAVAAAATSNNSVQPINNQLMMFGALMLLGATLGSLRLAANRRMI